MNLFFVLFGCNEPPPVDSASEPVEEPVEEEIPESFEVTGQIVDDEGAPIENANVMVGGRPETLVLTDENGNFSLWYTNIHKGEPAIVASKSWDIEPKAMSSSSRILQSPCRFVN